MAAGKHGILRAWQGRVGCIFLTILGLAIEAPRKERGGTGSYTLLVSAKTYRGIS